MLSDEQLIDGLREEMQQVVPPADLLERLRTHTQTDRVARPTRPRRRWRWRSPAGLIAPAVAVAGTIGVVVVIGLIGPSSSTRVPVGHHDHHGGGGLGSIHASGPPAFPHLSARDRKVIDDVMKAQGATDRADPGCATTATVRAPGAKPSLNTGTPSGALLSMLGVLRRPQTASDQLPPRKIWRGPHSKPHTYPYGTYPSADGIYDRYIRKARSRYGASYYVVPAANVNAIPPQPARCYREQRTALRQELPSIPRSLRATALALQPRYLSYERRRAASYPGIDVVALNDSGNGDGSSGYSVGEITSGHTLVSGAPSGVPVVYGLAPDGVRTVTFVYDQGGHHQTFTVPVINNVFILHNPHQRLPDNGFPDKLIWRSGGKIVKTITWG
jgi:hypothetical protein